MLKGLKENVLLVGLVLLLGVQLTGFTCLGEWQFGPASALVEAGDLSPSPDVGVTDDGCPCHFMFQTVSLSPSLVVSPFTSMLPEAPTRFVSMFIQSVFHPPALA